MAAILSLIQCVNGTLRIKNRKQTWVNIVMTNMKENIAKFTISQLNPGKQILLTKYQLVKLISIFLYALFMDIVLHLFYNIYDWNVVWQALLWHHSGCNTGGQELCLRNNQVTWPLRQWPTVHI